MSCCMEVGHRGVEVKHQDPLSKAQAVRIRLCPCGCLPQRDKERGRVLSSSAACSEDALLVAVSCSRFQSSPGRGVCVNCVCNTTQLVCKIMEGIDPDKGGRIRRERAGNDESLLRFPSNSVSSFPSCLLASFPVGHEPSWLRRPKVGGRLREQRMSHANVTLCLRRPITCGGLFLPPL